MGAAEIMDSWITDYETVEEALWNKTTDSLPNSPSKKSTNVSCGTHPLAGNTKAGWMHLYDTTTRRQETTMGRYAADNGGGDFTPAPAGTHVARCIRIVDIGTHPGEYQGKANSRNQVIVMWELPNELMEIEGEQKPIIISKFYTNSLSEKANLRKDLQSWRVKNFTAEELMKFDLMNILDKPCMLSVIHEEKEGKVKAKVVGVSSLPKGTTCPPAYNTPEAFWIDEWNQQKFDGFSDGIKKLISDSDEYKAMKNPPAQKEPVTAGDDYDDDIPF